MDKPSFTPEERQLMQRIIAAGDMRYLSFYASVLFAPTAFAIYGFMKQDPSAIRPRSWDCSLSSCGSFTTSRGMPSCWAPSAPESWRPTRVSTS